MRLLIVGGAGYIGSHMVKYAQDFNNEVVVLDDFSTGHKWSINNCEILNVNLLDSENLSKVIKNNKFDGVIHFAAKSLVSESINNPMHYYKNNVSGTINLVNEMIKNDIENIVFSSTAAIFGNPHTKTISEDHPKNPINTYGKTKLIVENFLNDITKRIGLNAICFRYFNAAGADDSGKIGELHNPETHLIPNVLFSALDKNKELYVYGNDYDTPDGTCIRDYVHVTDLSQAHLLGLKHIQKTKVFSAFNLGNGNGFSVLDVIKSCERVSQKEIGFKFLDRRRGDPDRLVANSNAAKELIGWDPMFTSLDDIVSSAYKWHKNNVKN